MYYCGVCCVKLVEWYVAFCAKCVVGIWYVIGLVNWELVCMCEGVVDLLCEYREMCGVYYWVLYAGECS